VNYQNPVSPAAVVVPGLLVTVLVIVAMWRVFSKAGRPGWAAIVPIYNAYTLIRVAGRSGWWLLLLIIPLVNLVTSLIISIDVARAFGRGTAFGVIGLWLFGFVGYPILGFGEARYVGPRRDGYPRPAA
jgi:hypothetical protein